MPQLPRFAALTLTPLAVFFLGATAWDGFTMAALLWLVLAVGVLGPALARAASTEDARMPLLVAAGHFVGLPLGLMAVAGHGPGAALDAAERAALFLLLLACVGRVCLPAAHHLIQRETWWQRWVGAMVLTSLGFGHHVSAHRLVHHPHLGTYSDPHTPLPGEGFWTYLRRAWAEGFRAGRGAEEEKLARHGLGPRNWRNPYWLWLGGEVAFLFGAVLMAGAVGVLAYLGLWLMAGTTVLMGDYLRHYGLWRLDLSSGEREAVGPHHAWAAPGDAQGDAPRHPLPLPAMALLAALPGLWRRVMDPRAARAMEAAAARLAAETEARAQAEMSAPRVPDSGSAATAPDPAGASTRGHTRPAATEEAADASMADAMHEAEEIEADGALIARVQDLVKEEPEDADHCPALVRGPAQIEVPHAKGRLKLSRPIRSSRRVALRDR